MTLSRRRFLGRAAAWVGAAGVAGGCGDRQDPGPAGGFLDDAGGGSTGFGAGQGPGRSTAHRTRVVVVGAGMAGLSAAWWLDRNGMRDFVVLEAAPVPGGNARWGRSASFPHPWGGRVLASPATPDAPLRMLLEELGVLRDGTPVPEARVAAPAHRLFRWGRWRRGLLEALFETPRERRGWRALRERAGAAAAGAPDPWGEPGPLDRTTMTAWLNGAALDVPPSLGWLVEHRCRDRYGAGPSVVSARAGLAALTDPPPDDPGLSWPEGTGWLARRLVEGLDGRPPGRDPREGGVGGRLRTRSPVTAIGPGGRPGDGLRVVTPAGTWSCEALVWAAPVAAAAGVVEGTVGGAGALRVEHAPWVVANLTLDGPPVGKGVQPAWHNVRTGSPSTGYVPADHQSLRTRTDGAVWTWYRPLDHVPPGRARARLATRPWRAWAEEALSDLEVAHPDIRRRVTRLVVRRLPRGTALPLPGRLDDPARRHLREADGPVVFAHADLAALPRVEHTVAEGVRAAGRVLERMGLG